MRSSADRTESPGASTAGSGVITVRKAVLAASNPAATTRVTTSRSVKIPIRRPPSEIGTAPMRLVTISSIAAATVADGGRVASSCSWITSG